MRSIKFLVISLATAGLFLFGSAARAADDTIIAVYDQTKQFTLYTISETSKVIVLPTPTKPVYGEVKSPDADTVNVMSGKDVKILTSLEFKAWLSANNRSAVDFNIKDVDSLYNQNWYFTVITDKSAINGANAFLQKAQAIDASISKDNIVVKLSDVLVNLYLTKDYDTYQKWRGFFQELLSAPLIANDLYTSARLKTVLAGTALPVSQTDFLAALQGTAKQFQIPAATTEQNLADAKAEIQVYLTLAIFNEDQANQLGRFIASGVTGYSSELSLNDLNKMFVDQIYQAAEADNFVAFRKLYLPMTAVARSFSPKYWGDNDFKNAFTDAKDQANGQTLEQFEQDLMSSMSIESMAQAILDSYNLIIRNSSNYLFFRLDFITDKPVYNYNGDADFMIDAKNYYQGEDKLIGEYKSTFDYAEGFKLMNPDLKDIITGYVWSGFSGSPFFKSPYLFIPLDTKTVSDLSAKERDGRRVSNVKQIMIALEMYYNDAGRYPESIKTSGPIAYNGVTFIAKVPANPTPGGKEYTYQVCGNGETYRLAYATEGETGNLKAGTHIGTPASIDDHKLAECKTKNYLPEKPKTASCVDSDGGKNIYVKGSALVPLANGGSDEIFDVCYGQQVLENYCDGSTAKSEKIACPSGCNDGACIKTCDDTDGGRNYFKAGAVGLLVNGSATTYWDYCDGQSIVENYCSGSEAKKETVKCVNGCRDSVCLPAAAPKSFSEKNAGKIFLQVESKGEAWYINPKDLKRYYLKDGEAAYQALRQLSVGISNANLARIPVGLDSRFAGADDDADGVDNQTEAALGTDPQKADSDGDGYSDSQELKNNFNPIGAGSMPVDNIFASKMEGKILLQVESKGEAWYVYQGKRYYLADGAAAYKIMRYLSTGVTNLNLEKVPAAELAAPAQ
ncbi:MAG: hypothetical protein WCO55_02020 [Candidatus Falkowbacteria bacterium]